jgi:hypothetical protein
MYPYNISTNGGREQIVEKYGHHIRLQQKGEGNSHMLSLQEEPPAHNADKTAEKMERKSQQQCREMCCLQGCANIMQTRAC